MVFSRLIRHKIKIFLVCMLTGWGYLHAQVNAVSPLTVFGVGDLSEGYFAQNFGIGGASIAMREPLFINMANPASYSALELTTLELAVSHRWIDQTIEASGQQLNNQSTYFNYFGMGFKFNDWWGFNATVAPFSFVGYNIFTTDSLAGFGEILYEFQGRGGINQVVIGNGFTPFKNFSVGINVRYLFGSWDQSDAVLFNSGLLYNAKRLTTNGVSSFAFDYGLQYVLPLQNGKQLIFGANYANQINLNAIQSSVTYSFLFNNQGNEIPFDTVSATIEQPGKIRLPSRYGLGVTYGKMAENELNYAWLITGEYSTTRWSAFQDIEGNGELTDAWRASLGGYFIPMFAFNKSRRAKTYFSRIQYRFGAFYENTQVQLNGEDVVNYGFTAGLGLPIAYRNLSPGERKSTLINIGIVVGNKGNGQADQINERYINLLVGITLGDQWFQKFKYR
jgi:hypothetical protein